MIVMCALADILNEGFLCGCLLILFVATLMHFIILSIKTPLVVSCHCFFVIIECVIISLGNSHCEGS